MTTFSRWPRPGELLSMSPEWARTVVNAHRQGWGDEVVPVRGLAGDHRVVGGLARGETALVLWTRHRSTSEAHVVVAMPSGAVRLIAVWRRSDPRSGARTVSTWATGPARRPSRTGTWEL